MASRKAENAHVAKLEALMIRSGLICPKSVSEEQLEEEDEQEEEEIGEEEQEAAAEEMKPEEEDIILEEMMPEQISTLFPSPSLRRLIPERVRNIEALNRIKVLPKKFSTSIDPNKIPKIRVTAARVYIDILAKMTGCNTYHHNMAEFWFLDTLANLLLRAQDDYLDKHSQAALIQWFCEWMKEMQQFDAASRQRMLRRWKDNMVNAARFVGNEGYVPSPAAAGVYYEAGDQKNQDQEDYYPASAVSGDASSKNTRRSEDPIFECSLNDLVKITHYLYDLFSTDFQYNLVRMIFTFGPEYELIDGPFQIETPKKQYVYTKPKPKPKTKVEKPSKKAPTDTEDYMALMELKAKEMDELYDLELADLEDYIKRHSILPLSYGNTEALYDLYFPPPSEEEVTLPPPPPPPTAAKKGKK